LRQRGERGEEEQREQEQSSPVHVDTSGMTPGDANVIAEKGWIGDG
jgi:hypothetical protein